MLKACPYCGHIHPMGEECPRKPHRTYKRTPTDALRNTNRWHKKRQQIRTDAHNMCEVCKDHGHITTQGLEIHHIEKLRDAPDLLTDDTNLICLCTQHHKQADTGKLPTTYLQQLAMRRIKQT